MPYTYTYPHEPVRPPRWMILAWAAVAAAAMAVAVVGSSPRGRVAAAQESVKGC